MFKSLFKKKSSQLTLNAPLAGKAVPLEEVPDQVFNEKMMGDGMAIIPADGKVVSPVDGEVVNIFDTKHAVSFRTKEGAEIMIHLGLDTVQLKGEGFEIYVSSGDKVKKGDSIAAFDIEKIKSMDYDPITPIILLNSDDFEITERVINQEVAVNDRLLEIKSKA